MALGAVETAMEIAIAYARERIQFGSPLSEKQVTLTSCWFRTPSVWKRHRHTSTRWAERLDSSDEDLQVEGSIAKPLYHRICQPGGR